jgi:hypothetical protein
MMKIAGSGSESGSNSQTHGCPDPRQNVMDPQYGKKKWQMATKPLLFSDSGSP